MTKPHSRPGNTSNHLVDEVAWEKKLAKLIALQAVHGHTRVSRSSSDRQLAGWVNQWWYKKKLDAGHRSISPPKITAERVEKLEMLGFEWTVNMTT